MENTMIIVSRESTTLSDTECMCNHFNIGSKVLITIYAGSKLHDGIRISKMLDNVAHDETLTSNVIEVNQNNMTQFVRDFDNDIIHVMVIDKER